VKHISVKGEKQDKENQQGGYKIFKTAC
jgi:hypothetical protein